jgi:hypothetical protein
LVAGRQPAFQGRRSQAEAIPGGHGGEADRIKPQLPRLLF